MSAALCGLLIAGKVKRIQEPVLCLRTRANGTALKRLVPHTRRQVFGWVGDACQAFMGMKGREVDSWDRGSGKRKAKGSQSVTFQKLEEAVLEQTSINHQRWRRQPFFSEGGGPKVGLYESLKWYRTSVL
jgi:hypothetical protein